jgi:hypothetical protein
LGGRFYRRPTILAGSCPVRAGIVTKPEEYLYSSARNYAELESPIEIIRADFLWKTI